MAMRLFSGLLFVTGTLAQASISVANITSQCTGCDMRGSPTQTGCSEVAPGVNVPCSVIISLDIAQDSSAAASASNASRTASTPMTAPATTTTSDSVLSLTSPSSYPPFIRPSENNQDCDIWGPLCQTGSITVGLNASTPTTTVVACSEYLSAQAVSAFPNFNQFQLPITLPTDYHSSFGRSPECTSFANADLDTGSPLTFANCNNASHTLSFPGYYVPPGVYNAQANAETYHCCGPCQIHVDEVRIAYFPSSSDLTCKNNTSNPNITNPNSTSPAPITPLAALPASASTIVLDGYTYTAPSLYLKVVGTAAVSDSCGPQSPVLTNPTLAIPFGGLSTISYDLPVGGTFAGRGATAHTKPLALEDLACPTFGFSDPFNVTLTGGGGEVYTNEVRTVGPPWNPVIVPPKELLGADKGWRCSGFEDDSSPWVITYGIFDPPQALTAFGGLQTPTTTTVAGGGGDPGDPGDPGTKTAEPGHSETVFRPTSMTMGGDGPGETPLPVESESPKPDPGSGPSSKPGGGDGPSPPAQSSPADPPSTNGPSDPSSPSPPSDPSDPSDPADPSTPSSPSDPHDPSDPPSSPNPSNPQDPSNPSNPQDPSDPSKPSNPSNPSDPSSSSNPQDPSDPSDPGGIIASAIGISANPSSNPSGPTPVTTNDISGSPVTLPPGTSASPSLQITTNAQGAPVTQIVATDIQGSVVTLPVGPAASSGSNSGGGQGGGGGSGDGGGGSDDGQGQGGGQGGDGSGGSDPASPSNGDSPSSIDPNVDVTTVDASGHTVTLPPGTQASPSLQVTTDSAGSAVTNIVATDKQGSAVTLPLGATVTDGSGSGGNGGDGVVITTTNALGQTITLPGQILTTTNADGNTITTTILASSGFGGLGGAGGSAETPAPTNIEVETTTGSDGQVATVSVETDSQGVVTGTWTGGGVEASGTGEVVAQGGAGRLGAGWTMGMGIGVVAVVAGVVLG